MFGYKRLMMMMRYAVKDLIFHLKSNELKQQVRERHRADLPPIVAFDFKKTQ